MAGRAMQTWALHFPDSKKLEMKGYPDIAYCPSAFHNNRYSRTVSRYLRERCTGRWRMNLVDGGETLGDQLSKKSIRNRAYNAISWLNWADVHRVNLEVATYDDVLDYQRAMARGDWSARGKKLSPSFANQCADEACSFMKWFAARGMRDEFKIRTKGVRARRFKGTARTIFIAQRANREKERRAGLAILELPRESEVLDWLAEVRRHRGYPKMLACKLIVIAGLRRGEVCSFPVDDWPTASDLRAKSLPNRSEVNVLVRFTKGGSERVIRLDINYARLVRNWIDGERSKAAAAYETRTGQAAPPNLFLSDARHHEGTPVSEARLYECFKRPVSQIKTWYPHHGRHYFACTFLLDGLQKDARAAGSQLKAMPINWIRSRSDFWIDTLRRQLGHIDDETTELYTRWIATHHAYLDASDAWTLFISGDEHDD